MTQIDQIFLNATLIVTSIKNYLHSRSLQPASTLYYFQHPIQESW